MRSIPETFCVLPWIHSFVNSNGAYQVCCTAEEYHDAILDRDGAGFNIKNLPHHEVIYNSDFMKTLRLKMLKGEWSELCTRCRTTEENGGTSRRILENQEYQSSIQNLINQTNSDGSITIELRSIDYRLGNQCNLKCRMCSPFSSDKWIEEWNEVMPENEHIDDVKKSYFKGFDWIDEPYLLKEFLEKAQGATHLHFAGGEPFLSKKMIQLLELCVQHGISKNITLTYNTNMTVLPPRILELWPQFQQVKLLCSVDGFEKLNEYIRYPSRWHAIDQNLKFLDDNMFKFNISEILLSTTVQLYNVLNLSELYRYVQGFNNIVPALNLINLTFPHYLSTQVLPLTIKNQAAKNLENEILELKKFLRNEHKYLEENINEVINFMYLKDHSQLLKQFRDYTRKLDSRNQSSLHLANPKLSLMLKEHYLKVVEVRV